MLLADHLSDAAAINFLIFVLKFCLYSGVLFYTLEFKGFLGVLGCLPEYVTGVYP